MCERRVGHAHVRARFEELYMGGVARGLGVAYCVRRMCPWNSKNECSSAEVASRWMLPTLTLVGSMAAPPSGRMAKWAIAVPVHRGVVTREAA